MSGTGSIVPSLRTVTGRLRGFVSGLTAAQLRAPAFPADWTVADTLSHLGSGATLVRLGLESFASTGSSAVSDDIVHVVWDDWNAKSPEAQAADALAADDALLAAVDALTDEQRSMFTVVAGPLHLDLEGALRLRFSEVVLHSWDVEVVFDPMVILSPSDAADVLPIVEQIVPFVGRPDGTDRTVTVQTTDPDHRLTVDIGANVAIVVADPSTPPDLELPCEAFVRLVYGRLPATHVPAGGEGAVLDGLRRVFPGF